MTVHGYKREEAFTSQVEQKIVEAAVAAFRRLQPATFCFRLGEESSVGRNSRLLLSDGTIYWVGSHADAVRPTGPFDPELPVLAFRRADQSFEAILFNHSTHTIGTHKPGRAVAVVLRPGGSIIGEENRRDGALLRGGFGIDP